ncbi:porin [Pelagibacterales bacterium SAG-MED44]|nr:porin [Pelagibacterales bacterium SAG-MED44]
MNKLTKIGVSALAGSLVAVSAHAGSLSASGSASLSFADGDVDEVVATGTGVAPEGNQWTMGDSITMTGSGDMDNGMSISVSFEIDNDDVGGGNVYDSHSMTLDTNGMGTLTFAGHGGDGAVSALDDKSPNAYEESWDGVTQADEETVPNGLSSDNMFTYKSPDFSGTTVTIGYVPSGVSAKTPKDGYMDFSIVNSGGLMEGLTVGLGMGESEETVGTTIDNTVMFATYATGGLTVGAHMGEADGSTSATTVDFTAIGVTYAITDDFTIGYNQSVSDKGDATIDQEASGISASYTSGGVTVAGMINDVENVAFTDADDTEGYEFNISFAF